MPHKWRDKHEKVHPDPSNKLSVLNTPVHLVSCFPARRNTQGEGLWWLKNKALAAEGTAGRAMEGFLLIQIAALRIYKVTPTSTTCQMSPQKNAAAWIPTSNLPCGCLPSAGGGSEPQAVGGSQLCLFPERFLLPGLFADP